MIIQKFDDTEKAMTNPAWQDTSKILMELSNVVATCETAKKAIINIYDPLQSKWNVWCDTNLLKEESEKIKEIYDAMQGLIDLINKK